MAYLSEHQNPAGAAFQHALAQFTEAIRNLGTTLQDAAQGAAGYAYRELIAQAGLLAYMDVFLLFAVLAFVFAPFTLLFSPVKKAGGPGGH
jgi:DHA2 family multidrug resistance protein